MNKKVTKFLYLICLLIVSNISNAQSTFKEILEKEKGQKVPTIADKLIGNKIFEFSDSTYNKKHLSNDSIEGKVSVINFWFINCPPCIAEMKGLNEIVTKFENRNDLEFIAFALDDKKSLENDFFPKREFKFEVIPNSMNFLMFDLESPFGYPTTFVVDKSGIIRKIVTGSSRGEEIATKEIKEKLIPIIEELLKEK